MLFVIFCGTGLCGLYFWSAITDWARRLARAKYDAAQIQEALANSYIARRKREGNK
jgi:hypothetical protein